jgi:serine/threonine protein kinase
MRNVDLNTITEAAVTSYAGLPDARQRQLVQGLLRALHGYAQDVQLSHAEWRAGLAFLHGLREGEGVGEGSPAAPVLHRDVKAANIGLTRHNGALFAKLLDCGLAKAMRPPEAAGGAGGGAHSDEIYDDLTDSEAKRRGPRGPHAFAASAAALAAANRRGPAASVAPPGPLPGLPAFALPRPRLGLQSAPKERRE